MKETAVLFGGTRSLAGVVTESAAAAGRERPGVLLLNAGLLHRVGPHRLYVRLARRLAARGFPVLRFDFSGIGDSVARRDDLSVEQSVLCEGREAMDFLAATRRLERFVLIGLCAGAENAFRICREDPRVVGAAMIDGYAFRTPGYYARYLGARLLSAQSWRNLLARKSQWRSGLRMLMARPARAQGESGDSVLPRKFPPKEAVLADLRVLLKREVELCFIYSEGGMEEYYNYRGQFAGAFRGLDTQRRVRVEFLRHADHLFTALDDQAALLTILDDWAGRAFPGAPPASR
jgi:pimeloyl-ACP methyl ester carboxylesterase